MTFCVYPRCFLSPEDSLFCAHFIKMLHNMRVPGFLTIELIDIIVDAVIGSLFCMTEDEAGRWVVRVVFFYTRWWWWCMRYIDIISNRRCLLPIDVCVRVLLDDNCCWWWCRWIFVWFSFRFHVWCWTLLLLIHCSIHTHTPTILLLWNIHTYTTLYTYTTLHSCSIFFNEIWKSVNSWRYDNDAFASELKDTVSVLLFTT